MSDDILLDDELLDDETVQKEAAIAEEVHKWTRNDDKLGSTDSEVLDARNNLFQRIVEMTEAEEITTIDDLRQALFIAAGDLHPTDIYDGPPGCNLLDAPPRNSEGERHPLPWEPVNDLIDGGVPVGEPTIIVGFTGGGKSLVLSAIATKLVAEGKNILRIDWENAPELNLHEHVAILTDPPPNSTIPSIHGVAKKLYKDNPHFGQYINIDPLDMPDSEIGAKEVASYVNQWEAQMGNGQRIDAVLIDYFDYLFDEVMYEKYRDRYWIQDKIFMQLWRWARKTKRSIFVNIQLARGGIAKAMSEGKINLSDIGGSIGKVLKASFALTLMKNEDDTSTLTIEKARGYDSIIGNQVILDYISVRSSAGSRGFLRFNKLERPPRKQKIDQKMLDKWRKSDTYKAINQAYTLNVPEPIKGAIRQPPGKKLAGCILIEKDKLRKLIGGRDTYCEMALNDLHNLGILQDGQKGRGAYLHQISQGKDGAADFYALNIQTGNTWNEPEDITI